MHAYWRACNYLAVGMIYLKSNPLLRRPLEVDDVKRRLLGHWGASPALSFVWVHLNRMIVKHDLDVVFIAGPGHGAPGVLGPTYLEGTYSEVYTSISEDEEGLQKFFKQFSFPGHIGSHVTPETPGSIHEGGELGYSLSHAYGRRSTTPTSSSPASWAMGRRRPGLSRRRGTPTSSSTPCATGRCCRS
jgi:xylulose-5-phosphate/fructose-6-phosphate phosphoketolase